jgi:hypothetical protein
MADFGNAASQMLATIVHRDDFERVGPGGGAQDADGLIRRGGFVAELAVALHRF